jgi:hypothetical protein
MRSFYFLNQSRFSQGGGQHRRRSLSVERVGLPGPPVIRHTRQLPALPALDRVCSAPASRTVTGQSRAVAARAVARRRPPARGRAARAGPRSRPPPAPPPHSLPCLPPPHRPPFPKALPPSQPPPSSPPSRTKWTRLVHPSVLIGHVSPPLPEALSSAHVRSEGGRVGRMRRGGGMVPVGGARGGRAHRAAPWASGRGCARPGRWGRGHRGRA